ncbi:hypothetical protein Y032_0021g379 [Ancylostoma ceylanicum]|uniref:Uncharacterized protein n=1 Tax=Ancylostoma ceylanicum TaxID=53326 RepID=A0A016UZV0_9BILA|nr:hypothetical protein Y032_0021g379 [Ancylostoma ceylanicum]
MVPLLGGLGVAGVGLPAYIVELTWVVRGPHSTAAIGHLWAAQHRRDRASVGQTASPRSGIYRPHNAVGSCIALHSDNPAPYIVQPENW